ncbi:ubiquitin-conjugating enzyme/RWD-like protein [Tanacetum coccineum]
MSTRSSSSNLVPPFIDPESVIRNRRRNLGDPSRLLDFEEINMSNNLNINPGPPPAGPPPQNYNGQPGPNLHMLAPDLRTMEELCQPTMNGRGGLIAPVNIAPVNIQATDFGLMNHMVQQNGVTDDALRLYLFPYSLTHHATALFDRLPKNSIHTFQEMASKFLSKYFPPSMVTTKLRNDISNFRQLPDESLFEAWERYKLSIDRCPNHNMLPVTQIDTFYNGLTLRYRDTISAVAKDLNVAVLKKRKVVKEDLRVSVLKKSKGNVRTFYPITLEAFSDFTLGKVLVEEGDEVERGQPLCISRVKGNLMFGIHPYPHNHSHQMEGLDNEDVVLKRYQNFNKFDTVLDHTDDFFSAESSAMNQQPKEWVDKIREEWRILAEYLPETIFVRVYEDRMDLLRAVIVGPRETPYHNGLFFFDVCFPSDYPDSPPLVHYRSGGLDINPNMYKCGKVLLSLPKTSCGEERMWVLGSSTMLQLLVSIQDRILNAKPLFNDMTYSVSSGSVYGEESSVLYNRNTFIKTLKTMVYTMQSLPKNFEVFVVGYFRNLFGDILAVCDKEAKDTGSVTFKNDLNACIKQLTCRCIQHNRTKGNSDITILLS